MLSFDEFIKITIAEVKKHGRENIKPVEYPKYLQLGFKSPDNEWLLGINIYKAYFSKGQPWRRDTRFEHLGVFGMTREPPHDVMIDNYIKLIRAAVAEGERLRALH